MNNIAEFSSIEVKNQEETDYEQLPDLKPSPGLKLCSTACMTNEIECPFRECKHWINHTQDFNCDLISIDRNGEMTLRQIAERLGVSFVRIKQIEDQALKKLTKRLGILRTIESIYRRY